MKEREPDEKENLFYDYNIKDKKRYHYISATSFYPLWTWHRDNQENKILTANNL